MVVSLKKSVWLAHGSSQIVIEGKVKVDQIEKPLCLPIVQLSYGYKILQVLVVHPDLYQMSSTFQEMSSLLQNMNDGQYLFVIDLVILFYQGQELLQKTIGLYLLSIADCQNRTAPVAKSKLFVSIQKSSAFYGETSTGAVITAVLKALKVVCLLSPQFQALLA